MRICKYIALIVALLMVLFCCGCEAGDPKEAEVSSVNADARVIPADIQEMIVNSYEHYEPDKILSVYNQVLLGLMGKYDSVEEWLGNYSHKIAYIVVTGDENDHENGKLFWMEDETLKQSRIAFYYHYHSWNIFYQYVMNPELIFGTEVEVYAVYCMVGVEIHDGDSIYYVTDRGDYVLHKYVPYDEETYLVPADILRTMYKEIWDNPSKGEGARVSIPGLPGIEQYVIDLDNPPEFPPLPESDAEVANHSTWIVAAAIGFAVVAATGAVAVVIWRKKRTAQ